jgi:clumping factor B
VECGAKDSAGNTATLAGFTVSVTPAIPPTNDTGTTPTDTTPPVVDGPDTATYTLDDPAAVNGITAPFVVVAEDNVDGTARLQIFGGIDLKQDDIGGDISIECNPSSDVFSLGSTTVQCTAVDQAGNVGTYSWTVTFVLEVEPIPPGEIPIGPREQLEGVPPPPPPTEPQPEPTPEPTPEPEPEPGPGPGPPPPQEEEQGEEGGGGGTDAESPSE